MYLRIAREVAMDLNDIETILKAHQLTSKDWETLKADPSFTRLLEAEIVAWSAAGNAQERTKLKAGMLVEEWLTEANARIHDKSETLTAKTEVVKMLVGVAGMGAKSVGDNAGAGGERFNITINLGADKQIRISKDVTPKVIDGERIETSDLSAGLAFEVAGVDEDEEEDG
jgi:hypothetical protein